MQLLDHNGNALDSSTVPQATKQLARRDFLSKGMKMTAGGILAPSLVAPALMGVSGKAEALSTNYVTVNGVTYRFDYVSTNETKIYQGSTYVGFAKLDGTLYSVGKVSGSGISVRTFYTSTHRKLESIPPLTYYPGSTGGVKNALKCARSIYGYSKIVATNTVYATIYIYDQISTGWEKKFFNMNDNTQYEAVQKYIGYLTEAASQENAITAANGTAAVLTAAAVAAGCSGLYPAAVAAAAAALGARVAVSAARVKLNGAYDNLQAFNAGFAFAPV